MPKTKLFTVMYEKLTGTKLGNYKAQLAFKKLLFNQHLKLILVLDEIDAYITKNQKVLLLLVKYYYCYFNVESGIV